MSLFKIPTTKISAPIPVTTAPREETLAVPAPINPHVNERVAKQSWNRETLYQDWKPTLAMIRRFAHQYRGDDGTLTPLVGEDANLLTVFTGYAMARQSMLIHSPAGTGKSKLMDAVLPMMPREMVYTISYGSRKSLYSQEQEITGATFCVIREVQKALESLDMKEALKMWGEGKDFEYTVTDVSERTDEGKFGHRKYVMPCRPLLTTRATENEDFNVGDELLRRWLQVFTDPSMTQTQKVVDRQLRDRAHPWKVDKLSDDDAARILMHIRIATEKGTIPVAIPGAETLSQFIPQEFPIARSMTGHFLKLVDGTTRFHYNIRMTRDGYLIAAPTDIYSVVRFFGESFQNNCLRRSDIGRRILDVLPTVTLKDKDGKKVWYASRDEKRTEAAISEALRAQHGFVLEQKKIKQELEDLMSIGYVERDESAQGRAQYFKTAFQQGLESINWNTYLDGVRAWGETELSPTEREQFVALGYLNATVMDPLTDREVNLRSVADKAAEVAAAPKGGNHGASPGLTAFTF